MILTAFRRGRVALALSAALAAAFLIPGMAGHALAQQASMCGPREQIMGSLLSEYKEKPVMAGLSKGSGFLTVITASSKGTWTELVIRPDGNACMVDSGEGWQMNEQQPGDGT